MQALRPLALALLVGAGLPAGCGPDPDDVAPPAGDPPTITLDAAYEVAVGTSASFTATASEGTTITWNFGDGTSAEGATAAHAWQAPGNYLLIAVATDARGRTATAAASVAAYLPAADPAPVASSRLLFDPDTGWLWAPVPEADLVTVIDTATGELIARVRTCEEPDFVAKAPVGVVVTCARWEIRAYDPLLPALPSPSDQGPWETARWELRTGEQPRGVVADTDGVLWVAESARQQLLRVTRNEVRRSFGATDARAVALRSDGRVLTPRFRAPAFGGEVLAWVDPDADAVTSIRLARSEGQDTDGNHRGVPNLLDAVAISPDGGRLYLGGLIANIARGGFRDGQALTFETTARAAVRVVSLGATPDDDDAELPSAAKELDNQDRVSALALSPRGTWLWAAVPGTGTLVKLDAFTLDIRGSITDVGQGLNAVTLSPDGSLLFAHAWLDRTVHAWQVPATGDPVPLWSAATVDTEPLAAPVLLGKQLFHNTRDTRLTRDAYIACNTCHPDGDHDGQTWDFTDRGEGLRNTISLLGRGGLDMGNLHWSGNFDEVHDFEIDIRLAQGGSGLMADADWERTGQKNPFGPARAGVSSDLDALVAYVSSLTAPPVSPYAGSSDGQRLFQEAGCGSCHRSNTLYTDSVAGAASPLHDVGTLKPGSGQRLGSPLTGLDTPTLLGVFATAPYLHDGSAASLAAAVGAHDTHDLTAAELTEIATWLQSL
jgi:WD40 repeat protein